MQPHQDQGLRVDWSGLDPAARQTANIDHARQPESSATRNNEATKRRNLPANDLKIRQPARPHRNFINSSSQWCLNEFETQTRNQHQDRQV